MHAIKFKVEQLLQNDCIVSSLVVYDLKSMSKLVFVLIVRIFKESLNKKMLY
jgi:hypothetical protein